MALVDRIVSAESGGNPAARNPRSSAMGSGQFIASTWLNTIARHRPDLAGLPRDEQLALRADPTLSRSMTAAYAADNGADLRAAGFEPSAGNVYLSHFAGPSGAKAILGADPTAPAAAILGDAVTSANPFLAGMSAGDLRTWAARKVGDGSGASAPSAGAPATPVPFSLAPASAPEKDADDDLQKQVASLLGSSSPDGTAETEGPPSAPRLGPASAPIAFNASRLAGLLSRRKV